jgi:tRNA pseudouridine65 synthase
MGLLNILYIDDDVVVVDKPDGVLVHRTRMSRDHVFLLQLLRDQVGQFVYPVHRLDRPTSGVMVFGLSSEAASGLGAAFTERRVGKEYLAIVRGRVAEDGVIDHILLDENGTPQDAMTAYHRLAHIELPVKVGPHGTTRYSLLRAEPRTGRMHQIRRHLRHVHHPIIGDTEHGEGRHNRFFRETYAVRRLLLHAHRLSFPHPSSGTEMTFQSPLPPEFKALAATWEWDLAALELGEA